jgi:hypothetical protein
VLVRHDWFLDRRDQIDLVTEDAIDRYGRTTGLLITVPQKLTGSGNSTSSLRQPVKTCGRLRLNRTENIRLTLTRNGFAGQKWRRCHAEAWTKKNIAHISTGLVTESGGRHRRCRTAPRMLAARVPRWENGSAWVMI